MREGSALEFALQPDYKKFVATVGCCWKEIGPLSVRIDGQVVWERGVVQGTSPAERIEIDIPPGSKTLLLSAGNGSVHAGHAAWAEAGFLK